MPDSPPQSTKNPNQRFSVGVTRVCLSSGTLQIPFAMRGVFEPGSYQARDIELEDTHELTFEPPRSLQGLDEVFAAHELHPNDEVILTITKEGLELEVRKRPRRKAAEVKGEPWESVSGRGADTSARSVQQPRTPAPEEDVGDDQPALFGAGETARNAAPQRAGEIDPEDADAPRMVRARRIHTKEGRAAEPSSERPPLGRPQARPAPRDGHEPEAQRPSAARRFFEDPGDPDDPFSAEAQAEDAWRWERSQAEAAERRRDADAFVEDEPEAQPGGFFAKIAQAARGALSFRGAEPEETLEEEREAETAGYAPAYGESEVWPEPVRSEPYAEPNVEPHAARRVEERAEPRDAPRSSPSHAEPSSVSRAQPHAAPNPDARGRAPVERPTSGIRDPRAAPDRREPPRDRTAPATQPYAQDSRPGQTAEAPRDVIVEDPEAESLDRFGPAMLEVGEGDLRSRLIPFLPHPDVPVILRADLVARNFGLGEEVADAMLEDLTHDKVDDLVVTKVRDETYRISRAPTNH